MVNRTLLELKNISKTVALRLYKPAAAKAYKWLSKKNPDKHFPVCYYLPSLEGSLQNKHWDDFSEKEKTKLRLSAGLPK